jgi:hypothetical protein
MRTTTEKITVPSSTRLASIRRHLEPEFEPRPNMLEHRLLPLIQRFAEMLVRSGLFGGFLSVTE